MPLAFAQTTVPFIGCPTDGQTGPGEAPTGEPVRVSISPQLAAKLAYYTAGGIGVLAPRGWHCFDLHGSSGHQTYIAPQPLDATRFFPNGRPFAGPVIEIDITSGQGSGSPMVAEVVARAFPAYRKFARSVWVSFPVNPTPRPYPTDNLVRHGNNALEFTTPRNTEGLGTDWQILKSSDPIRGAAYLHVPSYDLFMLRARLPKELENLIPAMIRQFLTDAPKSEH
jgi:hypothetical protein